MVPPLTFVSQECPCKATPCPPGASHLLTQCPLKSAQCQGEGRALLPESEGSSRSLGRKVPVQSHGATESYLRTEEKELFSHLTISTFQLKSDNLKWMSNAKQCFLCNMSTISSLLAACKNKQHDYWSQWTNNSIMIHFMNSWVII